ncbi:N-acetylmuramoyl-L-alanine amidase [Frigoribacterium sp. Leaf263]|uniref:NAD(+)/NADH kinase n=1 Tax=Frigoribacterium sp. Leaf263 TaxID=1736313 RepID=UPI0006FAE73E|nr:NAD(+)/NADH kinase [Frigoribacterium sp. Leaf263]KQO81587.1 N-acetylmuramoyl-L-alanine amidase [Frigoribacterium sp. Leaf263]
MGTFTVGLVPHPTKSVIDSVAILRDWTARSDAHLLAMTADAARVGDGVELVDESVFRERVSVVVALGGDGTMLGAMRLVAERPVPVLGVNYGNVGFLVEVEPRDLPEALDRIGEKQFSLEAHHALEVTHTSSGSESTYLAFNDVSVARRPGEGVVTADLVLDDTPYGFYKADAIVASTPAGSTAYNYAAGGPILSPAVAAVVVTPVAPMSGIDRSVVLGPRELLRFEIGDGTHSAALEIDGRVMADVSAGCVIRLRLRRDAGQVIRLDADRHGRKGRLKLSLLDLPLREDQLLELVPSDVRARFRERAERGARSADVDSAR